MEKVFLSDYKIEQGKKTLIVTFGDSWTWGNHLGHFRNDRVYGKLLADYYDADWFNIAKCGCSNYWILNNLHRLLFANTNQIVIENTYNNLKGSDWPSSYNDYLKNKNEQIEKEFEEYLKCDVYENECLSSYDNVYIVLSLTETGREFMDVESMFRVKLPDEKIRLIEQYIFDKINYVVDRTKYKILIGRAFTTSFEPNNLKNQLQKNWIQVVYDSCTAEQNNFYDRSVITHTGPFVSLGLRFTEEKNLDLSTDDLKQYFISQTDKSRLLKEYLSKHSLFIDSYPSPIAHKLWAQYIIENFEKMAP